MELSRSGKVAASLMLLAEIALMSSFAYAKSKDCNNAAGVMFMCAVALAVVACAAARCGCPSSFFVLNQREMLEEQLIADSGNSDSVESHRAHSENRV